jgi:hypothetical protein
MNYYTYIYLNPLKPGRYTYGSYITFLYEPFYVGKGKCQQIYTHLLEKYPKDNNHKYYTIQKIIKNNYNPINFKIIDHIDEKCAFCYEIFLISLIGRRDLKQGPLTNHTDGGDGASNITEEARIKKRIRMTGSKNPMYGKKMSEESRIKMRNSHIGIKLSDDRCKKNRIAFLGKKHTEETKKIESEKHLGNKNGMFNKCWITNINSKNCKVIDKNILNSYLENGWKKGRIKYW